MTKLSYTKEEFEKHYFFYSGNNFPLVRATLMPEFEWYDKELALMYRSLQFEHRQPVEKEFEIFQNRFGEPSFISEYSIFYLFELNGDIFYYQISRMGEGNTLGILTEKNFWEKRENKDYMFHPKEYEWQDDEKLKNKFESFIKELLKIQ